MSGVIGKIDWVATEIATGKETSGVQHVTVEDVVVKPVVTDPMRLARSFRRVMDKIRPDDPRAAESVAYWERRIAELESPDRVAEVSYFKWIRLGTEYMFYHWEDLDPTVTGFGLGTDRTDVPTFGWEFFVVTSSGRATMRPEGDISFERSETRCGNEMVYTRFETDVSIRIARRGGDSSKIEAAWRVLIRQGSEIHWPSLVDGAVSPNGFLGTSASSSD